MNTIIVFGILINLALVSAAGTPMTIEEAAAPCVIDVTYKSVSCGGEKSFDMAAVFKRLSQLIPDKDFNGLTISNTAMSVIPNNAIADFQFSSIMIQDMGNLTNIRPNAFSGNKKECTLLIYGSTKINNATELFEAFRGIRNLQSLSINSLKEIPDNAFTNNNEYMRKLTTINIMGDFSGTGGANSAGPRMELIRRIGSNAFSGIRITPSQYGAYPTGMIYVSGHQIEYIGEKAFAFPELEPMPNVEEGQMGYSSNMVSMYVSLSNNKLTSESFGDNAFDSMIPLNLDLSQNNITYLNEKVFRSLLKRTTYNSQSMTTPMRTSTSIKLMGNNNFDCYDCRNAWFVSDNVQKTQEFTTPGQMSSSMYGSTMYGVYNVDAYCKDGNGQLKSFRQLTNEDMSHCN